ncbi:MAG: fibronectin type III domain-containing protein [Verrucomicrobia subdivision 3 bacterium]|nr:fibronectin type III domain-containing protein [Limisphaerales bacterium]
MKTGISTPFEHRVFVSLAALFLSAFTCSAFPIITNVVETGGDNEATDTVTAKWTGVTYVGGIANEPVPGLPAGASYTVGVFGNWAPCFVDRNHRWTNASATILIPPYLEGQEYIMSGNDNRNNQPPETPEPAYRLDVSVATDVFVYMLIDNRLNSTTEPTAMNANPPTFGPAAMQWILDEGWLPVTNGMNRAGNPEWPDEVGVDEGADNDHDQWSSVYVKFYPAGTFQIKQPDNPGRNMYGVVVASAAPPGAPSDLVAVSGDGRVTLNWTAGAGASGYIIKRSLSSGGPYDNIATNTTTTYTDTDVFNDTTYYYVVSGLNLAGASANSNEAAGTPRAAPTNVTAVGGTNQVTVSWDAFPGAATYTVSRSSTSGGPYTQVGTGIAGTMFVDTPVPAGRTNYYVVVAQLTGGGSSGQSSEASALTAPSAPTVSIAGWAVTALQVKWAATTEVVTQYLIEQSSDGVNFMPPVTVPVTPRYYAAGGLDPATTYHFRVQAQNDTGFSDYSTVVSATTPASGFNVNFANALNGTPANNPSPIPAGYAQDIGEVFGLKTNGLTYGWNVDITVDSRWRNNPNSPDLRWDTFNHLQKPQVLPTAVWEIEIPNGFYSVYMVSGDPTAVDSVFQFDIEGVVSTNSYVPVGGAWFTEFRQGIGVSDGRLTIKSGPQAANNKLNFIDIYPAIPEAPTIGTQPQSVTVEEFHAASLSVTMSGGSVPFIYQWYRGTEPVPDATGPTLSFPYARLADAGDYTVVVTNWGGSVTSMVATLAVHPDTNAPVITSVFSSDGNTIGICFSEELNNSNNQVGDFFNYLVNGTFLATNAIVRPDRLSVLLDLDGQISGSYTVTINDQFVSHADLAGNPMPTTTVMGEVAGFGGDVGGPMHMGSHFTCDGEDFEVVGGGADVWGGSDQFYLISRTVSGDFDARVRVTSLIGADAITKAVLVARESTNANARAYHISVNPPPPGRNQLELGLRSVAGQATASWGASFVPANIPNVWMRINRSGNTFTGFRSSNGVDWIAMGTNILAVPFPSSIEVGIGVTAHNNTLLATGTFSNFRISGVLEPVMIGNLSAGGGQFSLSFNTQVGATYFIEYKNELTDPMWTELTSRNGTGVVENFTDTTATVPRRFYRIRFQ